MLDEDSANPPKFTTTAIRGPDLFIKRSDANKKCNPLDLMKSQEKTFLDGTFSVSGGSPSPKGKEGLLVGEMEKSMSVVAYGVDIIWSKSIQSEGYVQPDGAIIRPVALACWDPYLGLNFAVSRGTQSYNEISFSTGHGIERLLGFDKIAQLSKLLNCNIKGNIKQSLFDYLSLSFPFLDSIITQNAEAIKKLKEGKPFHIVGHSLGSVEAIILGIQAALSGKFPHVYVYVFGCFNHLDKEAIAELKRLGITVINNQINGDPIVTMQGLCSLMFAGPTSPASGWAKLAGEDVVNNFLAAGDIVKGNLGSADAGLWGINYHALMSYRSMMASPVYGTNGIFRLLEKEQLDKQYSEDHLALSNEMKKGI